MDVTGHRVSQISCNAPAERAPAAHSGPHSQVLSPSSLPSAANSHPHHPAVLLCSVLAAMIHDHIHLLGPGSFSPLIIASTRRKVEEMKGDEIQMNQSCHLFAAQLASVQGGGSGCSSVGSDSLSYSCAPCCQAILRGLDANKLLG